MKTLALIFFIIPVISLGKSIYFDFENSELYGWHKGITEGRRILLKDTIENQYSVNSILSLADTIYIRSPKSNDLIINEIMADPSPTVLLPEIEYIELLNRSNEEISIKGWYLTINKSTIELPDAIIPPGGYVLLFDEDKEDTYSAAIHKISCSNFPVINNKGAVVILQDSLARFIHAIKYTNDWFETASKKNGGWSLEMINPYDPCSKIGNWQESLDYRGGTPGEKNSVFQFSTENASPKLWRVATTGSGSVMLYFSEPLDSKSNILPEFFTIDRDIGMPDSILPARPILESLELFFNTSFKEKIVYEISLTLDLYDCSGMFLINTENFQFSVSSLADSSDIVINEIMFDPEYGFTEYIELYNQSDKTIDLRNYSLIIGEIDDDTLLITNEYFPVQKGEYVIIADHYTGIDNSEIFSKAERIVYMENMPFIPNSGSQIYLLTAQRKICDVASYYFAYHNNILTETSGVALERISSQISGLEPDNWHSASSGSGYQTPAAPNSQSEYENPAFSVGISPKTITPNGDGVDDELIISYKMEKPGYMARIIVFDKNGRKVCVLANGDVLGAQGHYIFNGKDNKGNRLSTGYYILFFDAYNGEGRRHTEKKSFVVASN